MSTLSQLHKNALWIVFLLSLCFLRQATAQAENVSTEFTRTIQSVNLSAHLDNASLLALGEQTLPWRWDHALPQKNGVLSVEAQFSITQQEFEQLKTSEQVIALFTSHITQRYRLHLNQSDWITYGWQYPNINDRPKSTLIALPTARFVQGENTLHIEVRCERLSNCGLSPLQLANFTELQQKHNNDNLWFNTSYWLSAVVSSLMGGYIILLWLVSRHKFFLVSGIAEILFATRQIMFALFLFPPLPSWIWNAISAALFMLYVGFTCLASLTISQVPTQKIWYHAVRFFCWLTIPVIILIFYLGNISYYQSFLIIAIAIAFTYTLRLTWIALTQQKYLLPYVIAIWCVVLFGIYDFFLVQLPDEGHEKFRLNTLTPLILNVALGFLAIHKYFELQTQLKKHSDEAEIDRITAVKQERQNILADMHDSVGGHLIGLLTLVRGKNSYQQLEMQTVDAINALKFNVDSSGLAYQDIALVLVAFRHRIQPILNAKSIKMHWLVEPADHDPFVFTQFKVIHLLHLLQEVVSNCIAHAHCTEIIFKLERNLHTLNPSVTLSIVDNGVGWSFNEDDPMSGHGIGNILKRAKELGAAVQWQNLTHEPPENSQPVKPQGTAFVLTINSDHS